MYTLDREVYSAKLSSFKSGRKLVAIKTGNATYISIDFLVNGGASALEANGIIPKTASRLAQDKLDDLFSVFKSVLV